MIVTIAGNNAYAMKRRVDELTAEFVSQHSDLALERIDGEEVQPNGILDAVQAAPFLSERKMVVVRNCAANKALAEDIEQIISSVADSTDLIFYEPLTDKRTSYYKILKSQTQLVEFNDLDENSLSKWLVEMAKNAGGKLNLADAQYMVQRLGLNQQLLASELEKLVTYEPEITQESINLLTEPTPQSKIFDLLDQAFGGNKQKALSLYADQRSQKVTPEAILAMIAWQLDLLIICKLAGNKQPSQIAQDAGMSSFPVTKASSLAKKLSDSQLQRLVGKALEIDYKSKTRNLDLDEALKAYIVTI